MFAAVIFTSDNHPGWLEKILRKFSAPYRRNLESVVASRGAHLICTEGDCITHSNLVRSHVELAVGAIIPRTAYCIEQAGKAATQPA